jgi:putative transposase
MLYRRAAIAGATYFLTVKLAERHRSLRSDHRPVANRGPRGKNRHSFAIDACVVLPDHLLDI